MLSPEQVAFVTRHLESVDQDFYVGAGIWGEPFLCDDVMCYFDGETLQVVGSAMGSCRCDNCSRVDAVIQRWVRDQPVSFVNYFGPHEIAPPGERWDLVYSCSPRHWNVELFAPLPPRCRVSDLRRLERRGYTVWTGRRDFFTHEHLSLLRALAAREALLASDVGCLTNVATILRGEATTLFEARAEGRLAGFVVAHDFFAGRPLMVCAAFDRTLPGVSDLLYHRVMRHYAERGAPEIGMGYSAEEGLYRYKAKWGIAREGRPSWQFIWQREGRGQPFNDCLFWPWRLLTGKLPAVPVDPSVSGSGGTADAR
jgi:hypothetical protein